MIRDLVKEEAVARAVRWAEMLPADATDNYHDLAAAILAMRDVIGAWRKEAEGLAKEVERLEDEVDDLEHDLRESR